MNAKLLTEESLRDDLHEELMFLAGAMAVYGVKGDYVRDAIDHQVELLLPVVRKHIRRHLRASKEVGDE